MVRFLIVSGQTCGFLGTLSGILWGGVTFTRGQRKKYSWLKKLDGTQVILGICSVLFLLLGAGANIAKEFLTLPSPTQVSQGPRGELLQKVTPSEFDKELEAAAADRIKDAKVYFEAAERDFDAKRYQAAADGYRKSVAVLPTMSAYLNLGPALFYIFAFTKAQDAFMASLQLGRRRKNRQFEATFLNSIGLVYRNQGKLKEVLASHQASLELYKQSGNLLGQAGALSYDCIYGSEVSL